MPVSLNAPEPAVDPPDSERFEVHAWIGGRLRLIEGKGSSLEEAIDDLKRKNGYAEARD
jgi:hypothetical protein